MRLHARVLLLKQQSSLQPKASAMLSAEAWVVKNTCF